MSGRVFEPIFERAHRSTRLAACLTEPRGRRASRTADGAATALSRRPSEVRTRARASSSFHIAACSTEPRGRRATDGARCLRQLLCRRGRAILAMCEQERERIIAPASSTLAVCSIERATRQMRIADGATLDCNFRCQLTNSSEVRARARYDRAHHRTTCRVLNRATWPHAQQTDRATFETAARSTRRRVF